MQAFFWQQLDEEKMSEKKRRERREERSKKLEKRSKIIEYAKVVKFGNWYMKHCESNSNMNKHTKRNNGTPKD